MELLSAVLSLPIYQQLILAVVLWFLFRWVKRKVFNKGSTSVKDSVVVITGGSEGIGEAFARKCMKEEAKEVHIISRSQHKLDAAKKRLLQQFPHSKTRISVHSCDCSDIESVKKLKSEMMKDVVPDILVHSAGLGRWKFLHEMDYDEIQHCLTSPALAGLYTTRAFIGEMIEEAQNNNKRHFTIVFVQSPGAYVAWPGASAYIVSRWAFRGLHEAIKQDLASLYHRFSVQSIAFGLISDSSYFSSHSESKDRIPGFAKIFPSLTSDDAALAICKTVESGEDGVFAAPSWLSISIQIYGWIPSLFDFLSSFTGAKLNKFKKTQ